jgi:hypothetical protein
MYNQEPDKHAAGNTDGTFLATRLNISHEIASVLVAEQHAFVVAQQNAVAIL